MRVQTREDGLSIDQIVLSPSANLTTAPTTTGSTSTSPTTSEPVPTTGTTTPTTLLKVMSWNTQHGRGTDGVYSLERFIPHIVRSGANVVALQEVEQFVSGYGNEDQMAKYASLLRSATGQTWYYHWFHRTGGTRGQGNGILTTFPLEAKDGLLLSYSRSVTRVTERE